MNAKNTICLWLLGSAGFALGACGSSSDNGDAGADSAADVGATDANVETGSDAANDVSDDAPLACSKATFAMTTEALGNGNNGEWKSFGFDIDGLVSTAASTDVCQPNSGGAAGTAYPDGNNGIDNSWGKNILPIILSVDPTFATDVNSAIAGGTLTTLFELACLTPKGDVPSFLTKLFVATPLGSTPLLDGTDQWPVAPELLTNPTSDPDSAAITFTSSSITGTLFDTGPNQTFALRFPFSTTSLDLTLRAAHVQMTLSSDRKSATGGMIGGVMKTEDLVAQIKKIGYALNLCNSSVLPNIITVVRQASDIMSDGTQDPSKTCDGISIGLGFDATQAQRGPVGPPEPTAQSCP